MDTGYGVEYTADNLPAFMPPTLSALQGAGTRFIRLTWVDLSNTVRCRVIPIRHFLRIIASKRPAISLLSAAPGLVFSFPPPGFGSAGEVVYTPDEASLRPAAYAPGHASMFGWFESKDGERGPSSLCPRGLLKKILDKAAVEDAVRYVAGFETEFILLKKTDDGSIQPVNNDCWSTTRSLLSGAPETACLEDIVRTLDECQIHVEMYHSEAAPGQYEIVTGPLQPLQAADALVVTREVILNVADRHGLRATFAPRVFPNDCGNGCHVHISVHPLTPADAERPLYAARDGPEHLTRAETHFLSGVLTHLPALCALTLPTAASYARMQDGVFSGGTHVAWGRDARETPLRLCGAPRAGAAHFEFRPLDGTANPYVALAGVLGAGSRGIAEKTRLDISPCGQDSPAEMSAEERERHGIVGRLPLDLADARRRLGQDEVLRDILGDVADVWNNVNECLEKSLEDKAAQYGGDMMRVMVEHF